MSSLTAVADLLAAHPRVTCLTGAGVSQESGIATFRDAHTGLWAHFDPEQLASQSGFAQDPGLVWRWYMERLRRVQQAAPNPGHTALATLQAINPQLTLLTQNVDDLHERSGSRNVVHLHGQLAQFHCNHCRRAYTLRPEDPARPSPPLCAACGGRVRPSVVWFGEMLPQYELQQAWDAAQQCDVMLVIGTSGMVHPAAMLPSVAREEGAVIVDVNIEEGPISQIADYFLRGSSGQVLPALVDALNQLR